MIVVTDAGPLIYLASAGHLDLLRRIYDRVVVPLAVLHEVVGAGDRPGASEVAAATWLELRDEAPDAELLRDLDPGEAAAIPLAERLGAILLVDDAAARFIAESRGLNIIGTLGILLLAKEAGHLPAVAPVVDFLLTQGMYVSPALRARVLQSAKE